MNKFAIITRYLLKKLIYLYCNVLFYLLQVTSKSNSITNIELLFLKTSDFFKFVTKHD